jgi:hypothetical protein
MQKSHKCVANLQCRKFFIAVVLYLLCGSLSLFFFDCFAAYTFDTLVTFDVTFFHMVGKKATLENISGPFKYALRCKAK